MFWVPTPPKYWDLSARVLSSQAMGRRKGLDSRICDACEAIKK